MRVKVEEVPGASSPPSTDKVRRREVVVVKLGVSEFLDRACGDGGATVATGG